MTNSNTIIDKKKVLGNVIKWIVILGLLSFAFVKNKDFMMEAIAKLSHTSAIELLLIFVAANLYFVGEGAIISQMTSTGDVKLTVWQGICCTYMCAFYRLTTLGSGNGIAQIYYYRTKGINVSRGTGMSITQYTFQKITIGVFGVISFICLILGGNEELLKYSGYMLAGVVVISAICIFLFLITVSKFISDLCMKLAHMIVKEKSRLYPKLETAQHAIDALQEQGRIMWHNKALFIKVSFLNAFKFFCWYMIPGILFVEHFNVSLPLCFGLMAVCNMLGCVMVAPSGVGTLDFVFALFFGAIIPNGESVAAALVLYRFFTWIVPFIIGFIPAAFLKKAKLHDNVS